MDLLAIEGFGLLRHIRPPLPGAPLPAGIELARLLRNVRSRAVAPPAPQASEIV